MLEMQAKGGVAAYGIEPVRVLFPSPIGALGVEITGEALSRVMIDPRAGEKHLYKPFAELKRSEFLDEFFGHLSEYFAGARPDLDIGFDLGPSGVAGFTRRVLRMTAKIPYGKTRSYREIAEKAGRPDAYRKVLSILLANPIPIRIPCHRVITNKSGYGSYVAGLRRKKWLLEMEQSASNG